MPQVVKDGALIGLQAHWTLTQQSMDITWKELYAIVIAVHTWGPSWQIKGKRFFSIVTTKLL